MPFFFTYQYLCDIFIHEKKDIQALAERYRITLIYLFGSRADRGRRYLGGEYVKPDIFTDLDIAITLERLPVETIKNLRDSFCGNIKDI